MNVNTYDPKEIQARLAQAELLFDTNEKGDAVIRAYKEIGLEGKNVFNELLRFKALDQIISANKNIQTYGLSLEELFALAKTSTEEVFGPLCIPKEKFGSFYQEAFTIDPFHLAFERQLVEGLAPGMYVKGLLNDSLLYFSKVLQDSSKHLLVAVVEEMVTLLEDILQGLPAEQVTFYCHHPEAYRWLKKLYPLAKIVNSLDGLTFTHLLYIKQGLFDTAEEGLIEPVVLTTRHLDTLEGAHLYLPNHLFYGQREVDSVWKSYFETQNIPYKRWSQMLYDHPHLVAIEELVPAYMYKFIIDEKSHTKIQVGIREYKRVLSKDLTYSVFEEQSFNSLIPLRQSQLLDEDFTIMSYCMALQGSPLEDIPNYVSRAWSAFGSPFLPLPKEEGVLTRELIIWKLYESLHNSKAMIELVMSTFKERHPAAYLQCAMALRRPSLTAKEEGEIVNTYLQEQDKYIKAMNEIELHWEAIINSLKEKLK